MLVNLMGNFEQHNICSHYGLDKVYYIELILGSSSEAFPGNGNFFPREIRLILRPTSYLGCTPSIQYNSPSLSLPKVPLKTPLSNS